MCSAERMLIQELLVKQMTVENSAGLVKVLDGIKVTVV